LTLMMVLSSSGLTIGLPPFAGNHCHSGRHP
jgi:hypothetical protein